MADTRLRLNAVSIDTDGSRMLVDVLRSDFALTGTKVGCREGLCGACTVVIGTKAVRSCATPLKAVEGKQVLTIEGIDRHGVLNRIQQAFLDKDAFQCGFCTPGMILNAYALLENNPKPNRQQIIEAMDRNLCRCGAHVRILDAVHDAAAAGGVR